MRGIFKVLLVLGAIAVIVFLFLRSVRSTRSEPYEISETHLRGWTLGAEPGNTPASVAIALRPPRELAATLFRQLFARHAESFNGPTYPFVPLLLQDEFSRSFAGRTTMDDLLGAARAAGLDQAVMQPRCMGYRREAAPGVTRQLYFVAFDSGEFVRFRDRIAGMTIPNSGFDPAALSPVMLVAGSDEQFNRWLPLRVGQEDCVAPMSVESRDSR
jgi:hypothetical protein